MSSKAWAELVTLERTRGYLWPGATASALAVWRAFVRLPNRRTWDSDDPGSCGIPECCGPDPVDARLRLEGVLTAMSRRNGRALRRIVHELDERF